MFIIHVVHEVNWTLRGWIGIHMYLCPRRNAVWFPLSFINIEIVIDFYFHVRYAMLVSVFSTRWPCNILRTAKLIFNWKSGGVHGINAKMSSFVVSDVYVLIPFVVVMKYIILWKCRKYFNKTNPCWSTCKTGYLKIGKLASSAKFKRSASLSTTFKNP